MVAISVPELDLQPWPPERPEQSEPPELPEDDRPRGRRRLPDRATRLRRRRLAVLVVVVAVTLGAVGLVQVAGGSAATGDDLAPQPVAQGDAGLLPGEIYVVRPGDTLWSIAAQLAPGEDLRPVVDRLQAQRDGAPLEVGDRIRLDPG